MNLRDLSYLVAVADTRHFGRAAERCHVSQPTLSAQIRKLEDQLGIAVFERSRRQVEITEAGAQILERARRALAEVAAMDDIAQTHRDPLAGTLRVGAIPTISPFLLPLMLAPLQKNFPRLQFQLSEDVTRSLERRLLDNEIDAAVLATPVTDENFAEIPLYDEPFWLIHPPGHALENKAKITATDLKKQTILLLAEVHCMADQVIEVCRLARRSEDRTLQDLRAFSLETLIQLVAAGYGCTLLPALSVPGKRLAGSGLNPRPLDVADAHRRVRLVYRHSFPRVQALREVAGLIRACLPESVNPCAPPGD